MVHLRGVPLPVSTKWTRDSLVNGRTYTLARGPVLAAHSSAPTTSGFLCFEVLYLFVGPLGIKILPPCLRVCHALIIEVDSGQPQRSLNLIIVKVVKRAHRAPLLVIRFMALWWLPFIYFHQGGTPHVLQEAQNPA